LTAPEYNINAVDRSLAVLESFLSGPESRSLADLARETGIHKTTLVRIVSSLEARRFLYKDETGRYRLGAMVFALGLRFERNMRLHEVIAPAMRDLMLRVNESVSFHVRSGDRRICVFRIDANHSLLDNVKAGSDLPLRKGAAGKVLGAFEPGADGDADRAVREAGHAVSFGERDPDCAAVAAPVIGFGDQLLGALSVSGPRLRLTDRRIEQIVPHVRSAAMYLTDQFAGRVPDSAGEVSVSDRLLPNLLLEGAMQQQAERGPRASVGGNGRRREI